MAEEKVVATGSHETRPAAEAEPAARTKVAVVVLPAAQAAAKLAPITTSGDAEKAVAWLGKMVGAATVNDVRLTSITMIDPTKKAQYDKFVKDPLFAGARAILGHRARVWEKMLTQTQDLDELIELLEERVQKLSNLMDANLKAAFEKISPIETAYRSADGFFMNAQAEPGEKVDAWFFNAHVSQLMDPDDRTLFENLAGKVQSEYRFWSLKKTYSNLVLPGWVGDVQSLDRLGELAEANKIQVFTDAENFASYNDLVNYMGQDAFEGIRGSSPYKKYVSISGNYVLGRPKHQFEDEDLWLPPSAILAGRIFYNDEHVGIQQCSAGYDYGRLTGPQAVRFRVDRPQATKMMNEFGVNAVVDWDGYPRVMGDANLCNKEPWDSYSRIRTEDWIVKNIFQYLNKQAFLNISNDLLYTIRGDIFNFLDEISDRHGKKAITGFDVEVTASDAQRQKHEVDVKLSIKFLNSARYFNLKVLDQANKGKDISVAEAGA